MFILLPQLNSRGTINTDQTKPPIHMKPHKCTACDSQSQREVTLKHRGGGTEANMGAAEIEKLGLKARALQRGERERQRQGGSCWGGDTEGWLVTSTTRGENEWEMAGDRNNRGDDRLMSWWKRCKERVKEEQEKQSNIQSFYFLSKRNLHSCMLHQSHYPILYTYPWLCKA